MEREQTWTPIRIRRGCLLLTCRRPASRCLRSDNRKRGTRRRGLGSASSEGVALIAASDGGHPPRWAGSPAPSRRSFSDDRASRQGMGCRMLGHVSVAVARATQVAGPVIPEPVEPRAAVSAALFCVRLSPESHGPSKAHLGYNASTGTSAKVIRQPRARTWFS